MTTIKGDGQIGDANNNRGVWEHCDRDWEGIRRKFAWIFTIGFARLIPGTKVGPFQKQCMWPKNGRLILSLAGPEGRVGDASHWLPLQHVRTKASHYILKYSGIMFCILWRH